MLPSNRIQIIEQTKFTYSPLGKALEKQIEKQVDALKFLSLSNKATGLKQTEVIFPKTFMIQLITYKLKGIVQLQDIIKSN